MGALHVKVVVSGLDAKHVRPIFAVDLFGVCPQRAAMLALFVPRSKARELACARVRAGANLVFNRIWEVPEWVQSFRVRVRVHACVHERTTVVGCAWTCDSGWATVCSNGVCVFT